MRIWFPTVRFCRPIGASAWASPPPRSQSALKKNPPFATGPRLGRSGKVSRFAAGLCVVFHTCGGKCICSRCASGFCWRHVPAAMGAPPGDFRPALRETILGGPRSIPETEAA